MGRTVLRVAGNQPDVHIVGAVDAAGGPGLGRDAGELAGIGHLGVEVSSDAAAALLGADVLVDFSAAPAFVPMLRAAMRAGVAVVSGTTRLGSDAESLLAQAAERIAVLWAPNMSLGVQLLARLVEQAVRALGDRYDVEIVETHHNQKTDAPSGTALSLVRAAQRGRPELRPVHGREGDVGARRPNELGVLALRGGGVVGDHTVHLLGAADRIELTHRAASRDLFAEGALAAARFVADKPPGRYELADVVGTAVRA
ncbi:MAG: 4-hydroxy-tetrahydrodipicolinate reductase [Myxococcales bacterium]|nr:4-hydroxy-tetrahydrodipicolinate reductase [Myxococcales bacterium]